MRLEARRSRAPSLHVLTPEAVTPARAKRLVYQWQTVQVMQGGWGGALQAAGASDSMLSGRRRQGSLWATFSFEALAGLRTMCVAPVTST